MRQSRGGLHAVFHEPWTRANQITESFVWSMIVLSIVLLFLEFYLGDANPLVPTLYRIDNGLLAFFALEVSLRIISYHPPALDLFAWSKAKRFRHHITGRLRYCGRPLVMVDILTVAAVVPALRGLRAIRLVRFISRSKMFRYSNTLAAMNRAFDENGLLFGFAFAVMGIWVLVGGASLYFVEVGHNPAVQGLSDGLWWALVTLSTVGFGDIAPVTGLGRVVGGTLMVAGMFCLATFAGVVGHTLIGAIVGLREEQFRLAERVGHVVVCGYESGDDLLLTALSEEIVDERTEVVIFALGDRPVDVPPRFNWVSGDVTKESELSKVNLDRAEAVIVVGKRSAKPQVADAITLLTLFTLRSFMTKAQERAPRKKPLYVVSEILDSENVAHAKEAGADEVIESTRLGFSLLAHTLVHHGAGNLISTVASAGDLSLYVGELPPDTTGCFQEVLISLRTSHGILAIGYRRAGQDYLNPEPDALLEATDHILYLSRQCVLSVPEN